MKKVFTLLFAIGLVSSTYSQKNLLPAGEYYTELNGIAFHLTVSDTNEIQIALAKGKLAKTDSLIKIELDHYDRPTFGVKFMERNKATDSLTITFNKAIKKYYLTYIFIGLQADENDKIEYHQAKELIPYDTYYNDIFEITIPKTNYLNLLEKRKSNSTNEQYTYKMPQDISKIELSFDLSSPSRLDLSAEYDEQDQTITVYEGKKNPLVFHLDYDKYLSQFETPYKTENNIVWTDTTDQATNESYEYEYPYNFKLKKFENLNEALKISGEEQKPLVVFYLSEDNNTAKEYDKFIKEYESMVSGLMYDKYVKTYDNLHFYLLTGKDNKFVKKKALEPNTMIIIDANKDLLYKQNAEFNILLNFFGNEMYGQGTITKMYLAKRLDDAVEQRPFNAKITQEIFAEISQIPSYGFFPGPKGSTPETNAERKFREDRVTFYRLQSSAEQVTKLYHQLVTSHQNDTEVDYQFAFLASSFLKDNLERTLFKKPNPVLTHTDLLAIDYLLRFREPLENYGNTSSDDYNTNYYFYSLFPHTILSALNSYAPYAGAEMLQKMKPYYQKVLEGDSQYYYFLQRYLPEEFLSEYETYYNTNFINGHSIILQLNSLYEAQNSKLPWSEFKYSMANQANEAAWFVVENIKDQKTIIEALKWSKTSLDINPDNPYFLDTYAQLLYKNGNKKQALEIQEKAVDIVKKNIKQYGQTLLDQTQDVLVRMKNNTY